MALLTKEQIAQLDDLETTDIDVPEWGGTVRIRTLKGHERDAYENFGVRKRRANGGEVDIKDMRAKLLSMCLVGDDGNRLFTDGEMGTLNSRSSVVIDRLYDAAVAFNRLGPDGDQETLGNSSGEANDGSGSASRLALA